MSAPMFHRLSPGSPEIAGVHALLQEAFAYMEDRIDPPSSLGRMTVEALARQAGTDELWVAPGPLACMILTRKADHLYLGKLAVADMARGTGLARALVEHAADRARELGLPEIRLQTRVELVENQAIFQRFGFVEIGRTAHPGYASPTSITYARRV